MKVVVHFLCLFRGAKLRKKNDTTKIFHVSLALSKNLTIFANKIELDKMKTKHKISLVILGILIVGVVTYITIPFSKLEQIHVFREDVTPDDKAGVFIDRLVAYNHYSYVYKGVSFDDIPCYNNDGGTFTINIRFNWDNSITISENNKDITLNIDSIDFEPTLSYGVVPDFNDRDYFFENISFFDTQQMCDSIPSSIVLYRQTRSLRNGPHRYGFELFVNNHHLSTGNKHNKHIFEY